MDLKEDSDNVENENVHFNETNESLIDCNYFNEELETKWNEIDKTREKKINKIYKDKNQNDLNNFSIIKINLKSLIHPIEESSDFEEYCHLKIRQLEAIKQMHKGYLNNNPNIFTFSETAGNNYKNSFLKTDNENFNFINSYGNIAKNSNTNVKPTINDLLVEEKEERFTELQNVQKIFDIINSNFKNDENKEIINKSFNLNTNINNSMFNQSNYMKNISKIQEKFAKKIMKPRQTFLRPDDDNENSLFDNHTSINNDLSMSQKNTPTYYNYKRNYGHKNYFKNNYKNIISVDKNTGIKEKINENYNYLYELYPNLKNQKIFQKKYKY